MHTLTSTQSLKEALSDLNKARKECLLRAFNNGGRSISPSVTLAAAHKDQKSNSVDVLFLKGYHAISSVSAMLGDLGGDIQHKLIPHNYELATVQFISYEFFDGLTPNINTVERLMCIPKEAVLDRKGHELFNLITFDCVDETLQHSTFDDDHIKNLIDDAKMDGEQLVLGYTSWQINIIPLTHKA